MKRTPKCPPGFICADNSTMIYWFLLTVAVVMAIGINFKNLFSGFSGFFGFSGFPDFQNKPHTPSPPTNPQIYVVQAPSPPVDYQRSVRPDMYPEPVRRYSTGIPQLRSRGSGSPYEQIGILTAEGGSTSSASPDRTILPLYGRELDPRRSKWNYFTRTDGSNPVQVPIRYRNRICDDDTNGCDEISSDDSVHIPALGRAFNATVYRKSF